MDNRNEEIEIDLVMMAKYLISKWKIVLVLGIIFAALGFTYKFLNYQLSSVPLAEVEDYESKMAKYNVDLDNYKLSKELLSRKVELAQDLVDEQTKYLEESLIYNSKDDSYFENVYQYVVKENKSGSVDLTQDNTPNPGLSYAMTALSSTEFASIIAKSLNIETDPTFKVIREIFEIKVTNKNSFNLIVKGNSVKTLEIVDVCLKDVNNKITDYCKNNYDFESILISLPFSFENSLMKESIKSGISSLRSLNAGTSI